MIYTVVGGDLYRLKCGLVEQLPSGKWAAIVPCRIWNQPMGSPGVTGGFRTREAAALNVVSRALDIAPERARVERYEPGMTADMNN